jgi:Zn-dependent protease with chaperone function
MFDGRYYDGLTSRATPVQCVASDGTLAIRGESIDAQVALGRIEVSPRLGRTFRTLRLPGGAQVQSEDNDAVDAAFPDRNRVETLADRLERYPYVVAASVVVIVVAAIALFRIGLPWAAERVAMRLPVSVEQAAGEQVLDTLKRFWLKPSKIDAERQKALQEKFAVFAKGVPDGENDRVMFFNSPIIGANAFALPGGTIVVTDQLLDLFEDDDNADDEFIAVAAHEAGHEHYRHVMRSVLQGSAVSIVAAYFAGDVGSASTVVIAIPAFLLQNHYSRGFEEQADEFAFQALAAHNMSPRVFADAMRKLQQEYPDDDSVSYVSTHPLSAERIARAEAAADAFEKKKP